MQMPYFKEKLLQGDVADAATIIGDRLKIFWSWYK